MTAADAVLSVRPLSIVPEGDEFLVGDPSRAEYVLLPAVGIEVIRLLAAGHTVRQVSAAIGEGIDAADFVETLLELGFVSLEPSVGPQHGVARVRPGAVRPLFGPLAWSMYATCTVLAAGILTIRWDLLPRTDDIFFLPSPLVSIACFTALVYVLAAIHEVCHWAAARAEGLDATLRISRRLYFLAFETDLTQLWSLPRRRRYSALLAGMAFDATVLCAVLVARLGAVDGWWRLGPSMSSVLAALAFVQLAAIAAQFFVFTRTDLYAVLITATGCVNLWRVNQLRLARMVVRLSPEHERELADAHARDLEIARWYAWVYVGGLGFAVGFFVVYFLPATIRLVRWLVGTVAAAQFSSWEFWSALAFAAIVLGPQVVTLLVLGRDIVGRVRAASNPGQVVG